MPLAYAFKHVFRSWKLFLALLIGITLASAFFAGTDIKANVTAKQALDQQLSTIYVDMSASIQTLNSTEMLGVREQTLNIDGVEDAEIISSVWTSIKVPDENRSYSAKIVGITNNSHVYDGWLNSPFEIGENETYISDDSPLADEFSVGEPIQVNISVFLSDGSQPPVNIPVNLTVKGLAQLDEKARSIVSGYIPWIMPIMVTVELPKPEEGLLIVSWEKTTKKILEEARRLNPSTKPIETNVLIYIDRAALITPWDVDSSINNIKTLEYDIENKLAALGLGISVQNNLEWPLNTFRFTSMMIRFTFTLVSLPIFFIAWYMGTTVSNVSFNLRRREIGLLLTKGFSRGQILRMFLTQTLLIGLIGGMLGVFLGFLLNPLFTNSVQTRCLTLR